jgi:hypothetical protein
MPTVVAGLKARANRSEYGTAIDALSRAERISDASALLPAYVALVDRDKPAEDAATRDADASDLVMTLAFTGQFDAALARVAKIEGAYQKNLALDVLAAQLTLAGQIEKAASIAPANVKLQGHSPYLVALVEHTAMTGDVEKATAMAREMQDSFTQSLAMTQVGIGLAKRGDIDGCLRVLQEEPNKAVVRSAAIVPLAKTHPSWLSADQVRRLLASADQPDVPVGSTMPADLKSFLQLKHYQDTETWLLARFSIARGNRDDAAKTARDALKLLNGELAHPTIPPFLQPEAIPAADPRDAVMTDHVLKLEIADVLFAAGEPAEGAAVADPVFRRLTGTLQSNNHPAMRSFFMRLGIYCATAGRDVELAALLEKQPPELRQMGYLGLAMGISGKNPYALLMSR